MVSTVAIALAGPGLHSLNISLLDRGDRADVTERFLAISRRPSEVS
jgi:hypothetical protein